MDYTSNSDRSKKAESTVKREDRKVEKVVSGSVGVVKKGWLAKAVEMFVSRDVGNVKDYIIREVIVPSVKRCASDMVSKGSSGLSDIISTATDIALFGEEGAKKKTYTNYNSVYRPYYADRRDSRTREEAPRRTYTGYDDIAFKTVQDARAVLTCMKEHLRDYPIISVAEMYEMAGIRNDNYMLENFGWTDISSASICGLRDGGYVIKLPKAMPID